MCRNENGNLFISHTEKARAIRLHEDGKVLRLSGTAGGVVDNEVGGPNVEARVAVEDAEGPEEVTIPSIPIRMCLALQCFNSV